jgi:hypothetical protein
VLEQGFLTASIQQTFLPSGAPADRPRLPLGTWFLAFSPINQGKLKGTKQERNAKLLPNRCEARRSFERQGRRYWQCAGCQYQCGVLSGTIFESSKLPLTSWFLAMQLLTKSNTNVSALEPRRHLGVC